MSFLNIKDPKKRDAIVSDYLATVKRLQQKNLNEKAQDLVRRDDIERALEPVVRSTGKSTEAITKELVPIKEEIKALNERLENRENAQKARQQEPKEEKEKEDESELNIVETYYQRVPKAKLDKYFGVVMEGGRYKLGDKYVHVEDGSNLVIDHKKYIGTKGLWALIMKKHPTDYSYDDLTAYRDVIRDTNAMAYPNNLEPRSRVTSTRKWREIFPLFDDLDKEGEQESSTHHHHEPTTTTAEEHGDGLLFLPGDIKGLETKLNYLLGEYRAGNRSSYTRNQIVSILDELLRRKRISRKEYEDINTSFLK